MDNNIKKPDQNLPETEIKKEDRIDSQKIEKKRPPQPDDRNRNTGTRLEMPISDYSD